MTKKWQGQMTEKWQKNDKIIISRILSLWLTKFFLSVSLFTTSSTAHPEVEKTRYRMSSRRLNQSMEGHDIWSWFQPETERSETTKQSSELDIWKPFFGGGFIQSLWDIWIHTRIHPYTHNIFIPYSFTPLTCSEGSATVWHWSGTGLNG